MLILNILFTLIILCGIIYLVRGYAIGKVVGFSMMPTFSNGEIIIIEKNVELKVGEVYIFKKPNEEIYLIKRLEKIIISPYNAEINLYFLGDNAGDSIDSRYFGFVSPKEVKGRVRKIFRRRKT